MLHIGSIFFSLKVVIHVCYSADLQWYSTLATDRNMLKLQRNKCSNNIQSNNSYLVDLDLNLKGTATLMITMFYMKDLNKPWIFYTSFI